jgi:ribonuclease P protein component
VQRLKTRAQFQAVMAGTTVSRTAHFALHRLALPALPDGEQVEVRPLFPIRDCWIGAVLPKRWARHAVTRNAIRRQIYAVCDAHAAGMPAAVHVVRLRSGFDRKQFTSATSVQLKQAVRLELEQLVRKAAA